jgi:hypothetical protein
MRDLRLDAKKNQKKSPDSYRDEQCFSAHAIAPPRLPLPNPPIGGAGRLFDRACAQMD